MDNVSQFFLSRLDELLSQAHKRRPWLSDATDIPISTINGWYARGAICNVPDLMRILGALGITFEDFFSPYLENGSVKIVSKVRKDINALLDTLTEHQESEFFGALKMYSLLRNLTSFSAYPEAFFSDR